MIDPHRTAEALENVARIQKLAREVAIEYQRQLYDAGCVALTAAATATAAASAAEGDDDAEGNPQGTAAEELVLEKDKVQEAAYWCISLRVLLHACLPSNAAPEYGSFGCTYSSFVYSSSLSPLSPPSLSLDICVCACVHLRVCSV